MGGNRWGFSDAIYQRLAQVRVESTFNPTIRAFISGLPPLIPQKKVFALFWDAPTFKDVDCNYLLHVLDQSNPELIISTSSGNTVEGVARTLRSYNVETGKEIQAILLVPQMSAYKVSAQTIDNNPYVKFVVLRNATLDSTREFADLLKTALSETRRVASASEDLKTSAYAQMGLVLDDAGLFRDDACYVQTVSGGVGPAGILEAACEMGRNPELLIVQPANGTAGPIVDALITHEEGGNPFALLETGHYETSHLEPTLGSTKPTYAVEKLVNWRESGGKLSATSVTGDYLLQQKNNILKFLVQLGIYSNNRVGKRYFDIEKSGFIAIAGAMQAARHIRASNIVINFTGRRPSTVFESSPDFQSAIPYLAVDPTTASISELVEKLAE